MKLIFPVLIATTLAATLALPAAADQAPSAHQHEAPAQIQRHQAPEDARVYIASPLDGSTVGQTFVVRFGLAGMGVAPSGVVRTNTGHHHLLIDAEQLPPGNMPIPSDEHHVHFGGGQTQTVLHLKPGTHTLQLVLGDARHVQFKPSIVSRKITVHVM